MKDMANEDVLSAIKELSNRFDTFETFAKRRFDEISMEVNATSQLMDMAEEGISSRFSEILDLLGAISFHGDGQTAANAGVELDAVISITENAANRILDAADRIATKLEESNLIIDTKTAQTAASISEDINEILMACTFQDLTGQRIRTTIENLKAVEDRLSSTLDRIGLSKSHKDTAEHVKDKVEEAHKTNDQAAIDALFD
ncbi:MAG: protein phosphatase CheZ [Pseudomonadota bacterium]|jgi:chemotaxis protein CheZ|nr:protein phosphatase CheZ [Alphaproteobacteria bacterium]MEC7703398.1 protein phosphatase CheZ [Pseudomonadota bacterium]MEC9235891.1 protein phosphatase CheZ [Pseudomonadota bacterium]MED5422777.1 protein phosphatase CheZ [Pseudomonadota bacterium]